MSEFYDIDSTKVTHKEYWYDNKVLAVIGWVFKWLHIRLPGSTDDPNVDSTLEFVVEALPDAVLEQFQKPAAILESLGFHSPVYQLISDPGTQTTRYWATYQHTSGIHFARIHFRHNERAPNSKRKPFVVFFTEFADGSFFASSSGKADMTTPQTVVLKHKTGAPVAKLWEWHQERVAASGRDDFAAVTNREELLWSVERNHIQLRDFHLARGVFRPRSAESKAKAEAHRVRVEEAKATGVEFPEVMAHLNALQEKKPGWAGAFWVLLGSAILFLAAGAARWDWKFTLWLVPVLLFHEAGHWLAMRYFKYRNLRMFFIPLFGAAVTGQNWNVPGWKKAIVSLAGPLPGIFLGCALAIVALFTHKPWLNQLSLILLLMNGFNLLPVLPLDGGHILHTTLFCRNRWLDVAFRALAVLGLIGIAALGSGQMMIPLIVIMAISLPVAFKLGKVTDDLRRLSPEPELPEDNDRIPPRTAQTIIAAVRAALPRNTGNKIIAQHTINVFETLNARPPNVFATIGLLALHGGSVLLAVVFALLLTINMHSGLKDFFGAAIRQPRHSYTCGTSQTWTGQEAKITSNEPRNLIVVDLQNQTKAAAAFRDLVGRIPPTGRLTLFGESLLLSLPAIDDNAREKWFDEFQAYSTNAFVAISNQSVTVSLDFLAPTSLEATNLTRSLGNSLLGAANMHLVMPWSPEARQDGFDNALGRRAQWRRIDRELSEVWKDPEIKALNSKMLIATKRGARAESKRLIEEQQKLREEIQARTLEDLRTNPTNHIDTALIDLHVRISKLGYTNRVERVALMRQVAARLGEIPYEGDKPSSTALAYCASYGNATQHGLLIELNWVSFTDAATGLPAMADWLCNKHCKAIKYELHRGFMDDLLDEMNDESQ